MNNLLGFGRPSADEEEAWRAMWDRYNRFYRQEVPAEVTDQLFPMLAGGAGPIHALMAREAGKPVGFAHFQLQASSWNLRPTCYLEDLWVEPDRRGTGIARALILAVADEARQRGAYLLHWQTQEYNAPARSLYDTLAQRSSMVIYRRDLA